MSSAHRYKRRQAIWKEECSFMPLFRHHLWWLLHNCISHPLLGVFPTKGMVWFHDWTSQHLNCRDHIRPSPMPEIPSYRAWMWHNVAGHMAIGLIPVKGSFEFHDRTSEGMGVPLWV